MSWRGIHISKPSKLSINQQAFEVWSDHADGHSNNEPVRFPVEDIAWIILDTQLTRISGAALAICMERGAPIIISDSRHMPCGIALPFHQHYLQADVAHVQLAASAPLRKQLWRRIVQAKIANQARALDIAGNFDKAKPLWAMSKHATGDPAHVEAQAARNYWPALLSDFRRSDEADGRNALLNYGYAVLRGGVARCLVASGLLPAFGLHHMNKSNAFNLADDLIEPYRPIVDHLVYTHTNARPEAKMAALELADRQFMAKTLGEQVRLNGQAMPTLTAIERSVESLVAALRSKDPKVLLLPETGG